MLKSIDIVGMILFYTSLSFYSFARANHFKIEGADLLLDKNKEGDFTADHINITYGQTNISLKNKDMKSRWKGDQINLEQDNISVGFPFFRMKTSTDLSIKFTNFSISAVVGKTFSASFDQIEAKTVSDFYRIKTMTAKCPSESSSMLFGKRPTDLDIQNSDEAILKQSKPSNKMLSLCWDQKGTVSIADFFIMGEVQNFIRSTFYELDILTKGKVIYFEDMQLLSENNRFELKFSFDRKKITIKGSIHYLAEKNVTKVVLYKAYYGILSIKGTIYSKLRKVKSPYLEVKNKDILIYM